MNEDAILGYLILFMAYCAAMLVVVCRRNMQPAANTVMVVFVLIWYAMGPWLHPNAFGIVMGVIGALGLILFVLVEIPLPAGKKESGRRK